MATSSPSLAAQSNRAWRRSPPPRRLLPATILIAASAGALLARCRVAPACGRSFPSSVIYSDSAVLSAPTSSFAYELDRIVVDKPPGSALTAVQAMADPAKQSIATEKVELIAALGSPSAQHAAIVDKYVAMRDQLEAYREAVESGGNPAVAGANIPLGPDAYDFSVPDGVPGEFTDYLTGLIAFRTGDAEGARTAWRKLLERPADERHYRSTWAAFMIGRSLHRSDPAAAQLAYAQTRALAQNGFADSIGLAAASLGWDAQLEFSSSHFERAINLYMLQRVAGDASATPSLRIVCAAAFKQSGMTLNGLATDPLSRQVLTAYAVSGGTLCWPRTTKIDDGVSRWLSAMESLDLRSIDGADRIAWAAYLAGDSASAQRWLDRAPADSAIARWIESKLLLRAGKPAAAADALSKAVHLLRTTYLQTENQAMDDGGNAAGRAEGQLGAIQLTQGHYLQALDLLLHSGYWIDSGYVAERILTIPELTAYVDEKWPPAGLEGKAGKSPVITPDASHRIRHLLGRRLARAGQYEKARPYFPDDLQSKLIAYAKGLRVGHDESQTAFERSTALWKAASIARESGMELLGTEIEPDCFENGGRYGPAFNAPPLKPQGVDQQFLSASRDAIRRFNAAPAPLHRFHYRRIATDLAWEAADLMPDEDNETAHVLYTAGVWLGNRDAEAARRFYYALIQRCRSTKIGRASLSEGWFAESSE